MRNFAQVDVFTSVAGLGNPVAVVLDADGLDDAAMARFAAWTNLSETTFVLPPTTPGADYRVRIFTPSTEFPFAGHPTIGTCHALLEAGLVKPADGRITQECAAGLVPVELATDGTLTFTAPRADVVPGFGGASELPESLGGVAPQGLTLIDAGPRWLVGRVTPAELDGLRLDAARLIRLFHQHHWDLTLYAVENETVYVRSFFDAAGLTEDPVCGSGNVAVAAQLRATGARDVPAAYQARQGSHRGRDGHLSIVRSDDAITVGGQAVTVITGTTII